MAGDHPPQRRISLTFNPSVMYKECVALLSDVNQELGRCWKLFDLRCIHLFVCEYELGTKDSTNCSSSDIVSPVFTSPDPSWIDQATSKKGPKVHTYARKSLDCERSRGCTHGLRVLCETWRCRSE